MAEETGVISQLFHQWAAIFLPYGLGGLFVLAFIEASFFPVPPDVLIVSLTLAEPRNWLLFAAVATVGSVIGGYFGYLIGWKIGEPILERFVDKKYIEKGHAFFEKWGVAAVLLAAFTPIPFKVFTILSGVLYLDPVRFGIAALAGRAIRFTLVAFVVYQFGENLLALVDQYLLVFGVLGVVAIGGFAWYWWKKNNS